MRVYFDENFSPALIEGLHRIQAGRPSEDVVVCSLKEEFGQGTPDEEWIPAVARRHGVVITQDTNIHRTRAQWSLCQTNKVGVIFVRPPKKGWSYWDIVKLIIRWWPEITALARTTDRPFGFYLERDSSRFKAV